MKKILLPVVLMLFGLSAQAQTDFYFTGFETEGASVNIDYSATNPAPEGFGDHSDMEIKIDPNNDDPDDLLFKTTMSDDAYVKMWIEVPGVPPLEVVSSDSVVSSPFNGTGDPDLLGLLSQAPDGEYTVYVAGKTDGAPSMEPDAGDPNMEVLKFTLIIDSELSVDQNDFDQFTYYPNPVDQQLNLRAKTPIDQVAIYNLLGQEVKTFSPHARESSLDLGGLDSGLYVMKLQIGEQTKAFKIQKK